MTGKPKVEIARDHLTKAQNEGAAGDQADAVMWSFASLEAAIDALAQRSGIAIDQQHWKRREAAKQLYDDGSVDADLSELHSVLNEARKASIYDGEEPDLGDWSLEDALAAVERAVEAAESEQP